MKTHLTLLVLAFGALVLELPIAAVGLCLVIAVLMVGDALDSLPGCAGDCQQDRAACNCNANTKNNSPIAK
jgi:hypothetical protein